MTEKPEITLSLVKELIAEQFPQWADLPIKAIKESGWDNRTYRLGDNMLIRLPSAECYVAQVLKEQTWLPKLTPELSLQIPEPIALGKRSENYPFPWSVYKWLEGESANHLTLDDMQLEQIAVDLAQFLNELHQINITDGPLAGEHNFYRGAHPSVYDAEARASIKAFQDTINVDKATAIWEKAISSKWERQPVWVHGDIAAGNLLIKNDQLNAVIDFGCLGVGDPACDLMIAWTFFKGKSREIFKSTLQLDDDTWARARGWTLWKALQQTGPEASQRERILAELFSN